MFDEGFVIETILAGRRTQTQDAGAGICASDRVCIGSRVGRRVVDWALIFVAGARSMQITFAASEATPFAKTGGLADVVGALPRELVKLGHKVTVFLPFYARVRRFIEAEGEGEPRYAIRSLTIPFSNHNRFAGVVDGGVRDGVQHYFIDCPELFDRKELYGPSGAEYSDNAERFGLFCRAVIEASKQLGVPDVFHVHDWQAALIPVYLRTTYLADPDLLRAAHGAHHSQCRLSGLVSAQHDGTIALSLGCIHHGQAGTLRPL